MIYILNSDNNTLTKYYIDKLRLDSKYYEYEISKDNATNNFNKLMEFDLLEDKKLFIFRMVDIFSHKKSILPAKSKKFCIQAINNSIYDCIIIQEKKAQYEALKLLDCDYSYIEFTDNEENRKEFFDYFLKENNIQISKGSFNTLKTNLDNDLEAICSELIKLSIFEEQITTKSINLLSYKNVNSNVFNLLEFIIKNETSESKLLFNKLIKEGIDPVQILGIMSSQIKYIFQVTSLRKYKVSTIISKIGGSKYRAEITLKNYPPYTEKKILSTYKKISSLDYLVKSGNLQADNCIDILIFN